MNTNEDEPDDARCRPFYRIRVEGLLDSRWSDWFDGLVLSCDASGDTTLSGPVQDQAALFGLLSRLRDLGLTLVSVVRVDDGCRE